LPRPDAWRRNNLRLSASGGAGWCILRLQVEHGNLFP
jgi:hypothetical protein